MTNSCNSCGLCCKLFLINLSPEEYQSGIYQTMFPDCKISNFTQAKKCGANLLAKKDDDSCIYLINHQCSIHTTRPNVCRNFFCTSQMKKFISMVEIIKKNDHQKKSSVFTP